MALHSLSICTGLAGIERGIESVAPGAFKPVLYCEREISVAAIVAKEIESGCLPAAPIWSDVKTLTRGSVARYLDEVGVDCITGGYPCQPFSCAGRRRGRDDPRHLWPWIADAIERYRPALCFFENVAGHLILGLEDVANDLQGMGYRVAAGLFTAAEVGASHRRERLFIMAHCDESGLRREGHEEQSSEFVNQRGRKLVHTPRDGDTRPHGEAGSGRGVCETGDELEYSTESRLEGEIWTQFEGGRDRPANDGIPVYPPGPGEREQWRRIIDRYPELAPALADTEPRRRGKGRDKRAEQDGTVAAGTSQETPQPAFRGVADGLSRADQLRAYGNAVVPDCAAVAFLSLFGSLYRD